MVDEESIKKEVTILLEKYKRIVDSGKLKDYKEEMTKKDLILPLFEALGWDVINKHEDQVSAEEKVSRGRVDYAFRLKSIPKFFLEAKSLHEDTGKRQFMEQAITYSWLKGVTWSVLTNFKSIKVFNSDVESKSPAHNLFFDLSCEEFLSRFDQLLLLTKESFENGLIDKEAEKWGKKMPKKPLTEQLFSDMVRFRKIISDSLRKHNEELHLKIEEVDEIVQRLLSRFIFMRTLEDREYEAQMFLPIIRSKEKTVQEGLNEEFRRLDKIYNSKLFASHLCEDVKIGDSPLIETIEGLLTPEGQIHKYDFEVIDADILGGMYEQFLGHIEQEEIPSESKKETKRKKHGIFYTPKYVVEFTIKEIFKNFHKSDLNTVKVVDPSCGSGSFLIKVYDYLAKLSSEQKVEGMIETSRSIPYEKKIELIQNHMYGVDLDPKAIEISQLNLFLKSAEKNKHLPVIKDKIRRGNSLIDDRKIEYATAFKWQEKFSDVFDQGGFDVIIGNPPWVFTRGKHFTDKHKDYFDNYIKNLGILQEKKGKNIQSGKLNLYSLFILRCIPLLKDNGYLGFVIPNNILRTTTYDLVRKNILDTCKISTIVDLSSGVFEGVTASSVILILQKTLEKQERDENEIRIIHDVDDLLLEKFKEHTVKQGTFYDNPSYTFSILVESDSGEINTGIAEDTEPLGDICQYIIEGIVGKIERDVFDEKKDDTYKPFLVGKDIGRYETKYKNKFIRYHRDKLHRARPEEVFLSEKILVQRISGGNRPLTVTYDKNKFYTFASLNNIILKKSTDYSYEYITAALNSNLLNWYYSNNFSNKSTLTVNISKTFLEKLPIKKISKDKQKEIIKLVREMLTTKNKYQKEFQTDEKKIMEQKIKNLEKMINDEIYKIYEIDSDTIEKIESNLSS
ncbi:UDP-glucuronate 4-epimerase protein [Marine Group I thaumarchaeote SCGC AAA799-E16]|uniref:site-specific DNA-methyltransferase (adenine-specific) n=2 Tax=Marine Group I TaxID=905826 RepID=A0A087S180_9ARCH|nr:UDP-glucuronate 4-epimerase protein [Marine Group I thaumarchaeote SCGC AAA799-E16]KFM19484.1 UDP-glucuronate 4-epimerase protein [Marine Group I thaumarchaeote SCGC RSA3]